MRSLSLLHRESERMNLDGTCFGVRSFLVGGNILEKRKDRVLYPWYDHRWWHIILVFASFGRVWFERTLHVYAEQTSSGIVTFAVESRIVHCLHVLERYRYGGR